MRGRSVHRSPGVRGAGRKRLPSLRGGPPSKAPRYDNDPSSRSSFSRAQYRSPPDTGRDPRGSFNRGPLTNERSYRPSPLNPPHPPPARRDRRSPPPQGPSSVNRPASHFGGGGSGSHNSNSGFESHHARHEPRREIALRPEPSRRGSSRERFSPVRRDDHRMRDRDQPRFGSGPGRQQRSPSREGRMTERDLMRPNRRPEPLGSFRVASNIDRRSGERDGTSRSRPPALPLPRPETHFFPRSPPFRRDHQRPKRSPERIVPARSPNRPLPDVRDRRRPSSRSPQKFPRRERRNTPPHEAGPQQPRGSVHNRLGPKMKATQRLGGRRVRPKPPRQSSPPSGSRFTDKPRQTSGQTGSSANQEEKSDVKDANEGSAKKLIKIQCPHCDAKTITFGSYMTHLKGKTHQAAMTKLTARLKATLSRMRLNQREEQKDLDAKILSQGEANGEEGPKRLSSRFCKTCKLKFHQDVSEHSQSESHKAISRFLFPSCTMCSTQFFSPLSYEKHISSINHIKKKAALKQKVGTEEEEETKENETETATNEDSEMTTELKEGDFLTLDEVGEVDDFEADDNEIGEIDETYEDSKSELDEEQMQNDIQEEEDEHEATEGGNGVEEPHQEEEDEESRHSAEAFAEADDAELENETKPPKIELSKPVGENYIRTVEMLHCDLCHKFLPRITSRDSAESLISQHCMTSFHQDAYAKNVSYDVEDKDVQPDPGSLKTDESEDTLMIGTKSENEDQLDYE